MSSIFSKPLDELTQSDLEALKGLAESDRLEFKGEAYPRTDEGAREMLRDMSSFANAAGGHLVMGVRTDQDERATDIVGIDDADAQASRMLSSCRANIEEHIIGLNFALVPVSETRKVLIWQIPRGTRAPHMVTFKGLYQCWRRHGRQKERMSIEEIRSACVRTENVRRNLEDFIEERRQRVLTEIGDKPYLLLTGTPLVVKDEVVDTGDAALRDLLVNPPDQRSGGWSVKSGETVAPTLYGVASRVAGRRLELFRNGHTEFRVPINQGGFRLDEGETDDGKEALVAHPCPLAEYPLNFLRLVRAIAEHAGIAEPIIAGLRLFSAWGLGLGPYHPRAVGYGHDVEVWLGQRHLELPLAQFAHPLEPQRAAKFLADRLWNAFGHESCPMFDEEGHFIE